ncbi:probable low-specificity L-threonine aldolase 2 isoform X2 [Gopherus evgoodei]|nr:probable low-specificity L-threonine aldolase 2 isoform X2 [Gopherus evgoodei]
MAMRQAMAQAEVGDDDYGEDPTVNELQRLAAQLLGMEEALFVPTSTMANLIAEPCCFVPHTALPPRTAPDVFLVCRPRPPPLSLRSCFTAALSCPSDVPLPAPGGSAARREGGPSARLRTGRGCTVNMARWGRAWLWVPSGLPTLTMLSWAQVAGVHSQVLQDLPDGTLDLNELESRVRVGYGSRYHPHSVLICLENTHSSAGGRVLPLAYLREVRLLADRYRLRVHMDGARLMNAAVAQGVSPAQITQHCDSVSLCFSKGLGAPAGALVAGCREFVAEAWRIRKLLGGGMRQAGVLAAAARIGLEHMEETLQRDHRNARRFAQGIWELGSPICSVDPSAVETNMVLVTVAVPWLSPEKLCERMQAVSEEEVAETGRAVSVRLFPWAAHSLRAVWHCDVSAQDTQLAANKLKFVAEQCWWERGAAP